MGIVALRGKCCEGCLCSQLPTCTEGTDILICLESGHSPIVVDDVRLTIPRTGNHLLVPIALQEPEGLHITQVSPTPRDSQESFLLVQRHNTNVQMSLLNIS